MMRSISQSYKTLVQGRTAFYTLILSFFMLTFVNTTVLAGSATIANIKVDVSAANAVEAREKAFEEAQVKGYKMLASQFLSGAELENYEAPDINTVAAYVKDFEVTNEKLSATRYAGTYKIRYNTNGFMKAKAKPENKNLADNKPSNRAQKGHVLILPFFEEAGYPVIWRTNPFMQAWVDAQANNNAAPSIVPRGDIQDISAIRDDQALTYNPQNVANLKNRYRASQVAIVKAKPELMPDGTQNVAVGIYQVKPYGPELSQQISVRSEPSESREQFYGRVVNAVNDVFRSKWKRTTAVPQQASVNTQAPMTGPVETMIAQVNFNSIRQWVETKRNIEQARGVKSVSVKSLSPRSATLMVEYQGGLDNLRQNFSQNGVGLNNPLTQSGQASASPIYQINAR